ncbi:Pleckstrin homology domain-containing family A member 8 [Talaromyces islandicus]|uniref:Pleckstrin homology domain-containing family A member 8 n=1 Tax=Talaromyces islandicus TaxID=28573 RepID=A0A0U1LRX7_TALIS|nr:Pleckstrin homology domain-containing family A member 8 [Talaromyces islandicus]
MAPWLTTVKKSFVDVPVDSANDNAISSTDFLEAAESLATLFDALGSVAFTPVKNDILGNVKKIRDRQTAAPAESETLQSLVINELKTKKHVATEGLVWLVRGLDFTAQALSENISTPNKELADSFRSAYGNTLKPHHGFLIKPVFNAAMSATPYRKDFFTKLGTESPESDEGLKAWVTALENQVKILKEFQSRKEAKW